MSFQFIMNCHRSSNSSSSLQVCLLLAVILFQRTRKYSDVNVMASEPEHHHHHHYQHHRHPLNREPGTAFHRQKRVVLKSTWETYSEQRDKPSSNSKLKFAVLGQEINGRPRSGAVPTLWSVLGKAAGNIALALVAFLVSSNLIHFVIKQITKKTYEATFFAVSTDELDVRYKLYHTIKYGGDAVSWVLLGVGKAFKAATKGIAFLFQNLYSVVQSESSNRRNDQTVTVTSLVPWYSGPTAVFAPAAIVVIEHWWLLLAAFLLTTLAGWYWLVTRQRFRKKQKWITQKNGFSKKRGRKGKRKKRQSN